MIVKCLGIESISELVDLHVKTMPNNFTSLCGRSMLESLYIGQLRGDSGFVLGSYRGEELIGFASFVTDLGRYSSEINKASLLAKVIFSKRLFMPRFLFGLIRAFYERFIIKYEPVFEYYLLTSLASTAPGLGAMMIQTGINELEKRNLANKDLLIECDLKNYRALGLYVRSGFNILYIKHILGRSKVCLVRSKNA